MKMLIVSCLNCSSLARGGDDNSLTIGLAICFVFCLAAGLPYCYYGMKYSRQCEEIKQKETAEAEEQERKKAAEIEEKRQKEVSVRAGTYFVDCDDATTSVFQSRFTSEPREIVPPRQYVREYWCGGSAFGRYHGATSEGRMIGHGSGVYSYNGVRRVCYEITHHDRQGRLRLVAERLVLSSNQEQRKIGPLNVNALSHLLEYQFLIPVEWRKERTVVFSGTRYAHWSEVCREYNNGGRYGPDQNWEPTSDKQLFSPGLIWNEGKCVWEITMVFEESAFQSAHFLLAGV